MDWLSLLFLLVICLHLWQSWRQLQNLVSSLSWMSASAPQTFEEQSAQQTTQNAVYLLIPVYQESAVLKKSVEYFKRLADTTGVKVYYISTEKEGKDNKTAQMLDALAPLYSFQKLHYPKTDGMKAHQINWAIEQILALEVGQEEHMYFGLYDVDSRPDPRAIEQVLYGTAPIYQQPAIYLENYQRIPLFQKAGALLQTKWELCRNVPVLRMNAERQQRRQPPAALPSCTGHGLFIRTDIFTAIGKFDIQTITEDLELGYRLAFHDIPITSLKEADLAGYAPTAISTIPQASRWFSGEMKLFTYYQQRMRRRQLTLLVWKRYYTTLKWAFGVPLVLTSFTLLIFKYPVALVLLWLSFHLYIYEPFIRIRRSALWQNYVSGNENWTILFLLGCLRPLFNTLGPLYYFLSTPLHLLCGKHSSFIRTPKN